MILCSVMARMIQFTTQVNILSLEYEDKARSNQETSKTKTKCEVNKTTPNVY